MSSSQHDYAAAVIERTERVRERLRVAGARGVEIVGVTKGCGVEAIHAAAAAGLSRIGENFAQEMVPKVQSARAAGVQVEAHFIGRLQSNKVRTLAGVVDVWQTIDRESLVLEVARRAPGARVLVQVNSTGEPGKGGCAPDHVEALVSTALAAGLSVHGLMTVGPTDGAAHSTQQAFRSTRAWVDRLGLSVCSMGMSDDLEIAVQEGSTLVRIGTAIFGPRIAAPRG